MCVFFCLRVSIILTNNLWDIQLITYEIHGWKTGGEWRRPKRSKRCQTRRLDPIGVCFFSLRVSLILTNNLWHIQLITYEIHVREIGGG